MKYFVPEEFACPCCEENKTDLLFMLALDRARGSAGTPFVINSGYRCEDYNEKVGGVENSAHTKGFAADIDAPDSHTRFLVLRALLEHGFTRLGVSDDFVHVDADDSKPDRVAWTY